MIAECQYRMAHCHDNIEEIEKHSKNTHLRGLASTYTLYKQNFARYAYLEERSFLIILLEIISRRFLWL